MQRGPGTFTKPPGNLKLIAPGSLAGVGDRGGAGGPFPGEEGLAGGGGGVLRQELAKIYLGVGAVVDGEAGAGSAAALRCGRGGKGRPGSFTAPGGS